ncbi:type II toxin-antitoxin system PemK/MazF family toxin [Gloeocapsopsis dulcis]|uniref:type II toxin-antitoxin system PemK/MazF family toxin n=1 Tax=Gloeocapsopsis dulcis TaxID=2859516 RepID=UPI001F413C69|nr:type II toxin-antitoxin system PemK/MazF family toxin [Gloeocapsopsis dulcis]WNN92036.1 type II toxin-antitoxin system PemK/MazF family toxin [Gloeocapsopsis dulcis]
MTVDFPGVTGIKRRPAVVLSSDTYHANRPDVIVGLITTQTTVIAATCYCAFQSSSFKSETLLNSRVLCVTKVKLFVSAIAAICKS